MHRDQIIQALKQVPGVKSIKIIASGNIADIIDEEDLEAAFFREISKDELWSKYPNITKAELERQYRSYEQSNL